MAVMHKRLVVAAMTSQSHQSEANVLIFFVKDKLEPPEAVILLFTLSSSGVSADCSDSIAVPSCVDVFPMVDYLRCIYGKLLIGHAWLSLTYGTINIHTWDLPMHSSEFFSVSCVQKDLCYDSF